MTDAIKIIEREIEARKAFPNEYDPDLTRAMEEVLELARRHVVEEIPATSRASHFS